MEIQSYPDLEQLKVILWIAGPLIVFMLGVIGYFIKQQIEASKAIAYVVQHLNILVTELRTQHELLNPVFEKRLNHHSKSIEGNTNRAGSREGDGVYRKIRPKQTVAALGDYCLKPGEYFKTIEELYGTDK